MQPWQPTALLPVSTSDPSERLLSTADAKKHLVVDFDDDDSYIEGLVLVAEGYLDGFSGIVGRALVTQSWRRSFDAFPCGDTLRLPLGPLQSVSSVLYYDQDGSSIALGSSKYHAVTDAIGPCIRLAYNETWPSTDVRPDAVTVTWTCGYGAASAVPAPIIHAAKLIIGDLYANREATAAGLSGRIVSRVDSLLEPLRQAVA